MILNSLCQLLKYEFAEVKVSSTPEQIPALLEENDFDVILLDMNFSPGKYSGEEGSHG